MNRTDLDNTSLRTLAQLAPNHLCWIVFSFVGIITNLAVLITVAKTKELHNKSQMVIFCFSFVEVLYMGSYFGAGLARYSAFVLSQPQTSDQMSCALRQMPLVLTAQLMRVFSVAMALDRFLCVTFPIFYKILSARRYALALNSYAWLHGLIVAFVGFVSLDHSTDLIPACRSPIIFDRKFVSYLNNQDHVLVSLAGMLYLCSSCILLYRYKKSAVIGETQRSEWKRQVDFDVFVNISVIGLIYLACSGCASYLVSLANSSSYDMAILLTPFVTICLFVSAISHLFVYLRLNPKFRKGFGKIFLCRKQSVHPIRSS